MSLDGAYDPRVLASLDSKRRYAEEGLICEGGRTGGVGIRLQLHKVVDFID